MCRWPSLAWRNRQKRGASDLGADTIGFGAGLFFLGYCILEIPSTVSVVRLGARWVFVRVLILWGVCTALAGMIGTPVTAWLFGWLPHLSGGGAVAEFINGARETPETQFYVLRFMLGFFEGGFFPSVIVYLSLWFRPADRAKAVAGFMAAIPISSMIGLPVSGLLLGVDWLGLPGWRWIFILEGIAPVMAGIATLFFCPTDRRAPDGCGRRNANGWLKSWQPKTRPNRDAATGAWVHHLGLVLLLTLVYFRPECGQLRPVDVHAGDHQIAIGIGQSVGELSRLAALRHGICGDVREWPALRPDR